MENSFYIFYIFLTHLNLYYDPVTYIYLRKRNIKNKYIFKNRKPSDLSSQIKAGEF